MDFIQYIIRFLVGEDVSSEVINSIGYTCDEQEIPHYKLVIYSSHFFNDNIYGTELSIPRIPLKIFENIPILFGEPCLEKRGETCILHADLIASTYFLISRYEEIVRRNIRDNYGRFPGKESLPYKALFIDYPLVDKYGDLLRKLLRECGFNIPFLPQKINKTYLTHDVDSLTKFRHLRGFLGSFRHLFKDRSVVTNSFKANFSDLEKDPYYTFPFLFNCAKQLIKFDTTNIESIAFIKVRGELREDKPDISVGNKDFRRFLKLAKGNNVKLGLHASYEAGINPALIKKEKEKLEKVVGYVSYNRHHFLSSREPEDMEMLIKAGITDDFTMGYADVSGFRLGTSRAVKWINPKTKQLTNLILHPLTVMDVTLSNSCYMGLNETEAFDYVTKLIEETKTYNGDLCLLWHNTSVAEGLSYHKSLYKKLMDYLAK